MSKKREVIEDKRILKEDEVMSDYFSFKDGNISMLEKEIRIKNDSKIAIFLGAKPANTIDNPIAYMFPFEFGHQETWDEGGFVGSGPSSSWAVEKLQFSTSWDWLMLAIDKIEKLGYHTHIEYFGEHRTFFNHDGVGTREDNKIAATYNAVIQFIDWYNTFGFGRSNSYNSTDSFS